MNEMKENIVKKEIKGFKNHWVRSDGYLEWKFKGDRRITQGVQHRDGHFRVILCDGRLDTNKRHDVNLEIVSLPHLVAEYFIDNPNGYTKLKHLDCDYTNNSPMNLEWVSDEEWDSMRRCYKGEVMYEIDKAPHYYITESGIVLSSKEDSLDEIKGNGGGTYGFIRDSKPTTWGVKRILKHANKGKFSKKEHAQWLKEVEELTSEKFSRNGAHRITKVIHLPTVTEFDSVGDAGKASEMTSANVSMHCRGKVSKQRWAYLDDVDVDSLERWDNAGDMDVWRYEMDFKKEKPFIHKPTGEIYYSRKIASKLTGESLPKISTHLNNNVQNPKWEWVE